MSDKKIDELKSNLEIIEYFQAKNVLHKGRYCPRCFEKRGQKINFKIKYRDDIADEYGWRCSTCGKRMTMRQNTIFESFRLSFQRIIVLILNWAIQTRQADMARLAKCSRSSVVSVQQQLRKIAAKGTNQSDMVIGGPGRIVEIDESLYIKVWNFIN
jgi:hypothetical protein